MDAPTDQPGPRSPTTRSVVLPEDAGALADDLARLLKRIPPGWPRYLSCSQGWYRLLCELDAELAAICPDYEVVQIKEKFGSLRFYLEAPSTYDLDCCEPFVAVRQRLDEDSRSELRAAHNEHRRDPLHLAAQLAAEQAAADFFAHQDELYEIVGAFERRSAVTCERCGSPGELRDNGGWYLTRCEDCYRATL